MVLFLQKLNLVHKNRIRVFLFLQLKVNLILPGLLILQNAVDRNFLFLAH
jgi:hypothetical protein